MTAPQPDMRAILRGPHIARVAERIPGHQVVEVTPLQAFSVYWHHKERKTRVAQLPHPTTRESGR